MQVVPPNSRSQGGSGRHWQWLVLVFAAILTLGVIQIPAAFAATATLQVKDRSVLETNANRVVNVRIVLSQALHRRASVGFTTVDGTATAGNDYRSISGRVVFPPGTRVARVPVQIIGDTTDEANEFFKVRIFNPVRAVITDRVGKVWLVDDDGPAISASDTNVTEGSDATVHVTLSNPSPQTVTVAWRTVDHTASSQAPPDYISSNGSLTFLPGQTTKSVTIQTKIDFQPEVSENFFVRLHHPVNARINAAQNPGIVTIDANDT